MSPARLAWSAMPIHMVICCAVLYLDGSFLFASVADGIETAVEIAVVAAATTIAALAVGLPLRAIPLLRRWWLGHPAVTLVAVGVSLIIAVLAWFVGEAGITRFPSFGGMPGYDAYVPDWRIAIAGWCLLAFTTAHGWWPTRVLVDLANTPRPSPRGARP
ncbi:hypothetical protein [Curtobacterium luteum]|uniref:hypothetical protein n=1 Tax=Curtobacterium luteum TaxID=33881 RepID=UPI00381FDDAA